jgi:uncharacterized membrane-anchored protein
VNKVATVTAAFWVMKICATTLGETAGDYFTKTLKFGYGGPSLVLIGLFALALAAQLRAKGFHVWLFWAVVLLTSTAGTTMSDWMDRDAKLGYAMGTAILVSCLAVVLIVWRVVQGSLSVSRIETRRAEVFYWTAILFSNTLGTALGDWLADDDGLGFNFKGSAALIGGALAVVLVLYLFTRLNRVALFWIAFVLTRPFGATFGDVLSRPQDEGGLNLGTAWASAILAALLVGTIVWAGRRRDNAPAAA